MTDIAAQEPCTHVEKTRTWDKQAMCPECWQRHVRRALPTIVNNLNRQFAPLGITVELGTKKNLTDLSK